jgi:hypothetical protein
LGPLVVLAPDAGPAGVVVADLFSGVSFALGVVTPGTGPVVPGVFGAPGAPGPEAGPAGGVVAGVVVALFSGVSLALGLVTPGTGPVVPGGKGGAPFVPGTGSALALGSALAFGSMLGETLVCKGGVAAPF